MRLGLFSYILLPISDYDKLVPCLTQFSLSAGTMGLNVSWSKTKIQCLGRSGSLSDVRLKGQDSKMLQVFHMQCKRRMHSDTFIKLQWDSAVSRGLGHTEQRLLPDSRS